MLYLLKNLDKYILFPLRRWYLKKILTPYLSNNNISTVLDLGASDGRLSYEISKQFPNIKFEGVDTYVQPNTYIPIKRYDGVKLPYKDDSFDLVLIVDVIHHSNNPQELIKEAKRVTKKHILIKDHYYNNKFDYLLLKYSDYIGNKPYSIELPYNFLKKQQWLNIFNKLSISVKKQKYFKYNFLDTCKHVVYLLKK